MNKVKSEIFRMNKKLYMSNDYLFILFSRRSRDKLWHDFLWWHDTQMWNVVSGVHYCPHKLTTHKIYGGHMVTVHDFFMQSLNY